MELTEAIRQRRMVRSFAADPVDAELVGRLLDDSLRGPSAGNTRGVAWVVLQGPDTAIYWEHATTADWRSGSERYPGMSRAPVVALSLCSPSAYVERYGEPDKEGSGLGPSEHGDAGCSTMLLLLGVTAAGLGAVFLGNFRGEDELLGALGVPAGWRLFGAVLIGTPDGQDRPSESHRRRPTTGAGVVHRSRW